MVASRRDPWQIFRPGHSQFSSEHHDHSQFVDVWSFINILFRMLKVCRNPSMMAVNRGPWDFSPRANISYNLIPFFLKVLHFLEEGFDESPFRPNSGTMTLNFKFGPTRFFVMGQGLIKASHPSSHRSQEGQISGTFLRFWVIPLASSLFFCNSGKLHHAHTGRLPCITCP